MGRRAQRQRPRPGVLQWSAANRLSPRLKLPTDQNPGGVPLPERDRTVLLGQFLTDDRAPLRTRVAAVILLLSPSARITVDDIIRDGDQVLLQLGNPPTPGPQPVAVLPLQYLGQHVLDMPAPIAVAALGYHHVTTTRLAGGTTRANYGPRRPRTVRFGPALRISLVHS